MTTPPPREDTLVRGVLRLVWPQLAILLGFAVLSLLGALGLAPSHEELSSLVMAFFRKHGLAAVCAISFAENIVGVNGYFPGSVAILGAMSLTAGDPLRAIYTFACIFIPSFLAHQINFFIGRFSRRRSGVPEAVGTQPEKGQWKSWALFASTLWHPHFAALTSIAAGTEGMRYPRFLFLFVPTFLVWNGFWGVAMYMFGSAIPVPQSPWMTVIVAYVILWLAWDVFKLLRAPRTLAN